MSQKNDFEKIFIHIVRCIPNNNILNGIMMALRIIPLFLITHDWNIHLKYSINKYISLITTLPLIHKTNAQTISLIMVIILFIYSIINILVYLKYYKQIKELNKISHPKYFQIFVQIMFIINFVLAPYNFMFCIENYFCYPIYDESVNYKLISKYNNNCINLKTILIMIIQSILIIYLFILNILFSCIIAKPCFITSSTIITKLNEIKLKLAFFPLFQIFLVFDYYLPLKICIIIKCFIRAIYIWYYIYFFNTELKNFFTSFKFRIVIFFIDSMCFFSCLIEYIFLFNWDKNMIILQENGTIIIFKLIIEFILAFGIIQLFCLEEKKITLEVFDGKISTKYSYELLNKILYVLSHPEKILGTDLLYEIIEHFDHIFKKHKNENKCQKYNGINCYCIKYTYKDFVKQSERYLDIIYGIRKGIKYKHKILKTEFPILYKYIVNFIKTQLKNNNNKYGNNDIYLLILAFFYTIFDKNYNKGLFYLEEFCTSKLYQRSKLIKLQCILIKLVILEHYEKNLIYSNDKNNIIKSENSFYGIYKLYLKISDVILIENQLSNVLNCFIESLIIYKEKDLSLFEIIKLMKKFQASIKKMNKTLINTFYSNIITSYHLSAKLSIFYSFFYLEMPKNINKCFKNIFDITCQYEKYSVLICNTSNNKKLWKFIIKYVSDNLCSNLGFPLSYLKDKEVNEFNPESLGKCYDFNALDKIRMGNVQIILKEYIFINKFNHALLFNLIGIVVFNGDILQIFFKVYPYNIKYSINSNENINKKKIKNKNKDKDKEKENENINSLQKEECYVFTNKKGKVFAISKLFEDYFCLNLSTIKKYKINLFKDILKIESIDNKNIIRKNLSQIYENIAFLNFSIMQNSSNEEFSKTFKKIKEIQKLIFHNLNSYLICFIEKREIQKNIKDIKSYYFIYFSIEVNNHHSTFEKFLGKKKKNIENIIIFPFQTKIGEFVGSFNKKKKKKLMNFKLNKNQNDILIKIRQIQILSIKYLLINYNIKIREILDLTLKEEEEFNAYNNIVEKETNRIINSNSIPSNSNLNTNKNNNLESIDNINKFFRNRAIDEPYTLRKKKDFNHFLRLQIYILIIIWCLLTIIFIFLQSFIMYLSKKQSNKLIILTDILINSLITRNIIYSFITSLLSMQYIVNGLQNDTIIDNGFTNTISYHKNKIYDRVRDFLYYFKIFERQEKYLCDYNEIEVINIFFQELDYISVKSENLTIKHSLNSILANSHLHAYQVIESNLLPFLFNISYYDIENRELLGEEAFFQFVFDNYFCNGKYSWDEIDNLIYHHIKTKTNKMLILIYLISIISGILVCGIFIIESLFFIRFNNQIYAKYYINYNYLQFFNSLLLKKAYLIQEFINNTDIENLYKFNQEKITFLNKIDDNNLFKNNYIRINNKLPIIIRPYKIKELNKTINIKLGLNKSNSLFITQNSKEYNLNNENELNTEILPKLTNEIFDEKHYNNEKKKFPFIKTKKIKNKKVNDLNTSNLKNNHSSVKNLINESKIEFLNFSTEINQIKSKKNLSKEKQFLIYIIFFSISIVFLTSFFLINDLIIKKTLDTRIIFAYIIKNLIETVTNAQEIFNIYAISILKGKVITFNYTSSGYLNSYKELDYINNIIEHNIIEEAIAKTNLVEIKVFSVLEKNIEYFKNILYYLSNMDNENSCDFYINFYNENKQNYDFSFLNSFDYEISDLINECKNISFGVNSQGITSAAYNLQDSIINNYFEFALDNNKSQNLLNRVNDEKFISMWTELDLLYDKLIMNMVICWNNDLKIAENKYNNLNYFVYFIIMFFIFFIFVAYIIFFPVKTLRENNIISQIEPCLYNTIMF